MTDSLSITFRGMETSPAFDRRIRELAARMTRVGDCALDCRVVIESPHQHSLQGRLFHIRIQIAAPGRQIVVYRTHRGDPAHEDPYVALRDAFRAARRKLLRSEHDAPLRARISAHGRVREPSMRVAEHQNR